MEEPDKFLRYDYILILFFPMEEPDKFLRYFYDMIIF